jgi:hypothetical protein
MGKPYIADKRDPICGEYIIDINNKQPLKLFTVSKLQMNVSCTWRIHSSCGYPSLMYTSESNIEGEFDLIWGTYDGMDLNSDLSDWQFNFTTKQNGDFQT